MSPCTPCFRVIFSREDIASFGMVHLLYLSRSGIIAKVRKRKVVHASKTHLTRAVFLRANRKNRLFTKKNSGLSRKRNDSPATVGCFSQDSQPVGAVMLIKYDVEQTPELRLHSFAIKKHGAPTLRLAADTEEAAARWTTVIKEAIERNDQVNVACKLDELFRYVRLRKRNLFKEEVTDSYFSCYAQR